MAALSIVCFCILFSFSAAVKQNKAPVVIANRGDLSQKSYEVSVMSPRGAVCSLAEAPTAVTDIQVRWNLKLSVKFYIVFFCCLHLFWQSVAVI